MKSNESQLDWMHVAKGIGIILVVIGHFIPASSPQYWVSLRKIIYYFHMPLFFFLSGYLYSPGKYSYLELVKNKAQRLLYPFVTIATIFFVIKFTAGKIVNLEYPVNLETLYVLVVDPVNSHMPLLWFIHALFLIFAVYPVLRKFLGSGLILLGLVIFDMFIYGQNILVIGKALLYMPFFVFGNLVKENDRLCSLLVHDKIWLGLSLVIFLAAGYNLNKQYQWFSEHTYLYKFVWGIVGTIIVVNLSQFISTSCPRLKSILFPAGLYSMSIYLLHPLFESSVRIVFTQLFKTIEVQFEILALTAIVTGTLLPLFMEKNFLRQNKFTRKFILGMT